MTCPSCKSENTYEDGNIWICAECSHEWSEADLANVLEDENLDHSVKDANGNTLSDGDSVILIKDLKIKGSSSTLKGGTKVRNIRLSNAGDGHDIACKIEGLGSINLKSEFVRKA
ncbi:MAG: PhnA protein [Bdellovibrionales bacterium CG10_big_fil_rev_8_21_14_0_10_45_34]|nr:MAG: PhnA protein [Bdellovibrionales bacterium CG10_big_fil_rev_8_21_14_0_10_45_34]